LNLNVNYRTTVSLDEINYGECFELNGYYYMKAKATDSKDTNRYIVSLLNGNIVIQNAPCKVIPVKAECNIRYE